MKTKTKTYILLAIVLGIWGTIGYKIVNGISSDDPTSPEAFANVTFQPKTFTETDSFSIETVERDPFLGTLAKHKNPSSPSTKKTAVIEPIQMPTRAISYDGMIKKQQSKDEVFVVNIDNQQYLLKRGQTADSVKLISGNSKTIKVYYNKKTQTIKRQ